MDRSTSLYLDILRPLAAFAVLLGHVSFQNLSGGQLSAMATAGKQAVDLFFVLSGFVIAHVCAAREHDLRDYAISRAARIYSVAIPALILTAGLDAIGMRLNPVVYQGAVQEMSPGLLIRSVLFVGEQWNVHRFPGCNGPYWSLGFEVWYYITFGAFLFSPHKWRWLASALVLAFIGPKVAVMFPAWLMGVAVYRVCVSRRLSRSFGWLLLCGSLLLFAGFQFIPHSHSEQFKPLSLDSDRLKGIYEDYFVCALVSAHILGFSTVSSSFGPWLERHSRGIRWIAGATFSVYLVHLPIMHFLVAVSPFDISSPLNLQFLLAVTPCACLAFAEMSERRKVLWRSFIESVLRRVSV